MSRDRYRRRRVRTMRRVLAEHGQSTSKGPGCFGVVLVAVLAGGVFTASIVHAAHALAVGL